MDLKATKPNLARKNRSSVTMIQVDLTCSQVTTMIQALEARLSTLKKDALEEDSLKKYLKVTIQALTESRSESRSSQSLSFSSVNS